MEDEEDYPFDEKPTGPRKAVTARASLELYADLEFIVEVMNAFDKAKGKKGGTKWKMASVALLALESLRDRWAKRMGGVLPASEDRADYLRNAKKNFEVMRANAIALKSKK